MVTHRSQSFLQLWPLLCAVATAYEPSLWSRSSSVLPLEADITTEGLMANLRALDTIAKENGGNRAFGLPGYRASVDYVVSQTSKFDTAKVWTQDFSAPFTQMKSLSLRVGDRKVGITSLQYSPSTSEAGMTAPLVLAPAGSISCSSAAYGSLNVKGKIVLAERRPCPDNTTFAGLVRAAGMAGAVGIIIYNNSPSMVGGGTLGAFGVREKDKAIPAGFITQAEGNRLAEQLEDGVSLTATFQHTQINEQRVSHNVFAETLAGDPSSVIMLGAHLDSVQAGPGINDDGSGTTLLIEVFKSIQKHKSLKSKVRFAWWGAEESGLLGSNHYTSTLKAAEADNILAYLNFDMIARGYYGVFDGKGIIPSMNGPKGSEILSKLFVDSFEQKGINFTVKEKFAGNSDYGSFVGKLKKPSGGLFTGAGYAQDPCYHRACDTINNIDTKVLTTNGLVRCLEMKFYARMLTFVSR
jgi:Zn-dependent M28 family amino/carboxypeptidase